MRAQAVSAPTVETILAHPRVVKTLEDIKADDDRAFAEQKHITEIPAPPYKEKVRAEYYQKRMQELGFKDASIDSEGNVIALRKGTGGGRPKLVVSAHLDTVFPEGTDVTVKEKDGTILAPGIGDDSRGLAALLSLIKAMNANEISTVGDILFVGDGRRGRTRQSPRRQGAVPRSHRYRRLHLDRRTRHHPRRQSRRPAATAMNSPSGGPAVTPSRSSACPARSTPWAARSPKSPICRRRPIPRPRSPSAL